MTDRDRTAAGRTEIELAGRLRRCRRPSTPAAGTAGLDGAPLSFGQERMWLVEAGRPNGALYNCGYAVRLRGTLEVAALSRAVDELCRRHQVLRSVFVRRGETVRQFVQEPVRGTLRQEDLSHLPDPGWEAGIRARRATGEPYRPDEAPLVRCLLFRLGRCDHLFVLCLHHMVTDGWSESVINAELSALYAAYATGADTPLDELPLQYADHACAQRRRDLAHGYDEGLRYWTTRLAGAPPVRLPFDRAAWHGSGHTGETLVLDFPAPVIDGLTGVLPRGTTLFMGLLSAFAVLLARRGEQDDVVIGVPVAGRDDPGLECLVGLFVNTLGIRIDLSGDPRFDDMLGVVRGHVIDGLDHREV